MATPLLRDEWKADLLSLGPGWDSHSAKEITFAALRTVESFAVVPCTHGGVQLEIHRDGFDIEIEIGRNGKIKSAMVCRSSR